MVLASKRSRMLQKKEEFVCWISRSRSLFQRGPTDSLTFLMRFQGVKQVKQTDLNARFLFLSPPSLKTLEARLRGRGTDDEDSVRKRLGQAEIEMAFAREEGVHDKVVVNDDLEKAYRDVEDWIVDGGHFGKK